MARFEDNEAVKAATATGSHLPGLQNAARQSTRTKRQSKAGKAKTTRAGKAVPPSLRQKVCGCASLRLASGGRKRQPARQHLPSLPARRPQGTVRACRQSGRGRVRQRDFARPPHPGVAGRPWQEELTGSRLPCPARRQFADLVLTSIRRTVWPLLRSCTTMMLPPSDL
jgi:hypothetical protein